MCHSTCVKMCFALPQGAIESATGKSIELYLKLRAADFGLRTLSRSAEGFRVLGGAVIIRKNVGEEHRRFFSFQSCLDRDYVI